MRGAAQRSGKSGAVGQVRIIAGEWRGRKLAVADLPGLRPSSDRVRETLFNWLREVLPCARCLDLFTGSGALGLEAASRGANQVLLVDNQRQVVDTLRGHVQLLKAAERVQIVHSDALAWLRQGPPEQPFKIVFLDPPFADGLLPACIAELSKPGWLADNAWIYIERARDSALPELPAHWQIHRETQTKQVSAVLLQIISVA